ncbi:hypothetical protein FHG87_012004 [Trinorchestia longiramus]|nr:hypothetical protein FHG87_012004 [Trinorchestia longiramus]
MGAPTYTLFSSFCAKSAPLTMQLNCASNKADADSLCDEVDSVNSARGRAQEIFCEEDVTGTGTLNTTDSFTQIVACQMFDGSWEVSDVASILKISADELLGVKNAEAASVFVTSVVVVLLREHFNDRALEWDLMVTKAINFLKMNSAQDLNKLLQAAKHHLGTLCAQHPSIERCLR